MSPTEFSNYIKQRQQLQQNNTYHHQPNHNQAMYGLSVSPARSMSPNPVALQISSNDPFVFPSNGFPMNMYQSFGSPRNMFDGINGGGNFNQYNNVGNDAFVLGGGKCSSIMDQQPNFCKIPSQQMPPNSQAALQATQLNTSISKNNVNGSIDLNSSNNLNPQSQLQDSKLLDGISSFYSSSNASYQHLLVAN